MSMTAEERNVAGVCLSVTDEQAESLLRLRAELGEPGARFASQLRRDGSRAVVRRSGVLIANMDAAGFAVEFSRGALRRVESAWAPLSEVRVREPVDWTVQVDGATEGGRTLRVEERAAMEYRVWVEGAEVEILNVSRRRDGGSTQLETSSGRVFLNRKMGTEPSDWLDGQRVS